MSAVSLLLVPERSDTFHVSAHSMYPGYLCTFITYEFMLGEET